MSKVFQVFNGICYYDYSGLYKNASEASKYYAPNIVFVDAPDEVETNWGFDETKEGDARFIAPPEPEIAPEPDLTDSEESTEELLLEMAADHEERLCLLEMGVNGDDL